MKAIFALGIALIFGGCARGVEALAVPSVTLPVWIFYFSLTAVDTNTLLESDYSAEVFSTNGRPTLAWDASASSNVSYIVHRGTNTGTYTRSWNAGTQTTFAIPADPRSANTVITVTTKNATNIAYRPWGGTWLFAGKTNLTLTNPVVGLMYRAVGRKFAPRPALYITRTNT